MSVVSRRSDVDTMRGVACILLIFYHVVGYDPAHGLRLPDNHPLSLLNEALTYFRMPMFAFLSGVVYAFRPFSGDYGKFASGKFRRLLVPMLIVGTLIAVVQAITPGVNTKIDWRLLHIVPVAQLWFLESMFIIFMLIMVLEGRKLIDSERTLLIAFLIAGALSVGRLAVGVEYFGITGVVYLLPYFLSGIWFARYGATRPLVGFAALSIISTIALALYAASLGDFPDRLSLPAMLASLFFCFLLVRMNLKSKSLDRVGLESFAIYLLHPFFTAGTRIILKAMMATPPLWLLVSAGVLAGLVGPMWAAKRMRRYRWGRLALGETEKA